jgi:hypothetical protein
MQKAAAAVAAATAAEGRIRQTPDPLCTSVMTNDKQ